MTRLDRYFALRWISALVRTVIGMLVLYCVIDLLAERRNNIIDFEIPWPVVLKFYIATLPTLFYQTLPLAMLISALMVFGDAAQHNEITAALSGGIGLRRLLRWPMLAAAVVCAGMFYFDDRVGAISSAQAESLDNEFFKRDVDDKRQGVSWPALEGGWTAHVLKYNRRANTGETTHMYAMRPDRVEHIVARRIYWSPDDASWILEDGWWIANTPDWSRELSRTRITRMPAPIKERPEVLFALDVPPATKTIDRIRSDIDRAAQRGQDTRAQEVALYTNFSYPALNFIMMLVAIPCALWLGRGGMGISFGAAIAIAILFLMTHGAMVKLGEIGTVPPIVGAWAASVVFFSAGVLLFWRTPS